MRELIAVGKFIVAVFKKSEKITLYLPEGVGPMDFVGDMEVIAIGPDCAHDIEIGDFIIASPKDVIKHPIDEASGAKTSSDYYYCVNEDNIRAILREKVIA